LFQIAPWHHFFGDQEIMQAECFEGERTMNTTEGEPIKSTASVETTIVLPPTTRRLGVTACPNFPPEDLRSSIPRPLDGSDGWYRVTFVFDQPGATFDEGH
jgi:hypothetical protein